MNNNRIDIPIFTEDQNQKQCKKQTPDYLPPNKKKGVKQIGFRTKDKVFVNGTSLVGNYTVYGYFTFDSYDSYDNTCFVVKNSMHYNIPLTSLVITID